MYCYNTNDNLNIWCMHIFVYASVFSCFFVSMANSSRNPKHLWTRAEESCLVGYLVDLVNAGGRRSGNETFWPGYLAQLVRMYGYRLTSTTVIKHKIKLLKRTLQARTKMCGPTCSRFYWNDELKCIVAKKDVLDTWVRVRRKHIHLFTTFFSILTRSCLIFPQTHPAAKGLLNKPFRIMTSYRTNSGKIAL